jgi:hypothetical protein
MLVKMPMYNDRLVNSFCYYGLALNAHSWGGDVHLSFAINGFLEIPAYTMVKRPSIFFSPKFSALL